MAGAERLEPPAGPGENEEAFIEVTDYRRRSVGLPVREGDLIREEQSLRYAFRQQRPFFCNENRFTGLAGGGLIAGRGLLHDEVPQHDMDTFFQRRCFCWCKAEVISAGLGNDSCQRGYGIYRKVDKEQYGE